MDGGTVLFAGPGPQGFGIRVIVDHGNGVVSAYAHLSATSVRVGAEVRQGQNIGTSGNTGASEAPHLHVETNTGGDIDSYQRGEIRNRGGRHFDAEPYVGTGVRYGREANLQLGDDMPAVRSLQQALAARGYSLGPSGPDGDFGEATRAAVVAFQRERGMPAAQQTGVYGPATRAEMAEAVREGWRRSGAPQVETPARPAPQQVPRPDPRPDSRPAPATQRPAQPPSDLLREGDRGARVETVQRELKALGYPLGTTGRNRDGVDGDFGEQTRLAVQSFQRERGLPAAQQTGNYGPITRREMAEVRQEGWSRPATPGQAAQAPTQTPRPQTAPQAGTAAAIDTPGPYAAVSTGALFGTQAGTPLGALTADQSYALGRAIAGDGPGAAALEAVDRRLGNGSGVFVQRMLAMGQHEGSLDFGRRNPDPGRNSDDRTAGYDYGTFQIGGRGSTQASTAGEFERYLDRGIQVYQSLAPGAQVDRAALNVADRDILAHVGYMAARGTEAFGTPLPENEVLRRMADPSIRGDALAHVVRNDVQGGDRAIGQAVVQMTGRTDGIRVDLAAVAARGREPDALRREPSMPVFNQTTALKNSERGPVYSPAVAAWQQVLVARGLDVGRGGPDGVYGPATRAATEQVQREAGLPARGNVGPATWAAYGATGAQTIAATGPRPDVPNTPAPDRPQTPPPQQATPGSAVPPPVRATPLPPAAATPGTPPAGQPGQTPQTRPADSPATAFLRDADRLVTGMIGSYTRDAPAALAALVRDTRGLGSGPLGSTTAEDVQRSFARADPAARPLPQAEAGVIGRVLDERSRLVAEGAQEPGRAPTPGDGAATPPPTLTPTRQPEGVAVSR